MNKKIVKFVIIFSLVSLFLVFSFAIAQEKELEVKYPKIFGLEPGPGLPEYTRYVFSFVIMIAGLILVGVLIYAGLLCLTSAGQPVKLKECKDRIIAGFLGIIILLSGSIILYTISPQLLRFELPVLKPLEKKEVKPPPPLKPEEAHLITLELPLGQMIDQGVWKKEKRESMLTLIKENESFLEEGVKIKDQILESIPDLAKYLKGLAEECKCEETTGLCTKPFNFSVPVGCAGDPCPKEGREKIDEILKIIQEKQKKLKEWQEKITQAKINFGNDFLKYSETESKIFTCHHEKNGLSTLAEHLTLLEYFAEHGWKVEKITLPGAPPSVADPLNFYCAVGGSFFDYLAIPAEALPELPPGIVLPEIPELEAPRRISCPVEIPLGQVIDKFEIAAIRLTIELEKIIDNHHQMAKTLEKLSDYISQCSEKNCRANCCCVANPCFGCCSPIPCTICVPFCKSPCLQAVGQCYGKPCPYEKIETTIEELRKIDETISLDITESKRIITEVSSFIYQPEDPINLKNIREAMKFCYSKSAVEPTWDILTCDEAMYNFGPDGKIIRACHPRNLYCCTGLEDIALPWQPPSQFKEPITIFPTEKYEPLPSIDGRCPEGWVCDRPPYMTGPQYKDAMPFLKGFLSCMRKKLDQIQKERKLGYIGRISSITDSKLYPPNKTCDWIAGPNPDCSHEHGWRISDHYGGSGCATQMQSYAVDFGDEKNAKYIIQAAKQCDPGAWVCYTPINSECKGHYSHLHISVSEGINRCKNK